MMIRTEAGMAQRGATKRDVRLERSADVMLERIIAARSLVVREIGGDRNGEMAAHRVLGSAKLDVETLLAPHVARTAEAARGRRIVVAKHASGMTHRRIPPRSTSPVARRGAKASDRRATAPRKAFSFTP